MTTEPDPGERTAPAPLPNDVAQCAALIDGIDRQMVDLLISRFRLSRWIGKLKAGLGAEPFDPHRIRQQSAVFVESCVCGGLDLTMATSLIQAILHQVVAERLKVNPPQG